MTPHGWLLDTHALLWLLYDDPRLSHKAANTIQSDTPLFYSVVSFWEIALKRSSAGFDFELEDDWDERIPPALEATGVLRIEIEAPDCRGTEDLPLHHLEILSTA